jgi:hypothetical protein
MWVETSDLVASLGAYDPAVKTALSAAEGKVRLALGLHHQVPESLDGVPAHLRDLIREHVESLAAKASLKGVETAEVREEIRDRAVTAWAWLKKVEAGYVVRDLPPAGDTADATDAAGSVDPGLPPGLEFLEGY